MNWNQSNNNLLVLHISFWRIKHYGSGFSVHKWTDLTLVQKSISFCDCKFPFLAQQPFWSIIPVLIDLSVIAFHLFLVQLQAGERNSIVLRFPCAHFLSELTLIGALLVVIVCYISLMYSKVTVGLRWI